MECEITFMWENTYLCILTLTLHFNFAYLSIKLLSHMAEGPFVAQTVLTNL